MATKIFTEEEKLAKLKKVLAEIGAQRHFVVFVDEDNHRVVSTNAMDPLVYCDVQRQITSWERKVGMI